MGAIPVVSVVIPTYNHARYLGRALQSVLDQTFTNWEVIVVDNHSTDNTDEVMAGFADSRIVYLKIHNNGVIAKSRNRGIRAAKGEWIAFLDSDDWWTTDKLQTCFGCIDGTVDLVYHDLEIVAEQAQIFRRRMMKSRQLKAPVFFDLLLRNNTIANSSVMVRKNLIEKIGLINENPEIIATEDYNTWLRISRLTNQFKHVPRKLAYYFTHNQSVSKKDMTESIRLATTEFMHLLSEQQKIKLEANFRYTKGRFNCLIGDYAMARKNLLFSMKHGYFLICIKSVVALFFLIGKGVFTAPRQ